MAKNYTYTTGTLTITCYVHPDYKDGTKRYHGTVRVATINDILFSEVESILEVEITNYLSRCRLKNCDRTFSWEFKTI